MKFQNNTSTVINNRKIDYEINPLFALRWSKRAMTGASIAKEDLLKLFEAGRWAPSSFNNQPWRFVYALRDSKDFEKFLNLINESNQIWAKDAAALVVIASKKTFDKTGKYSRTHSFDAGAAWENIALQATSMGFVCHGIEGFDYNRAYFDLYIPEDEYNIEAMAAIGSPAPANEIPSSRKVVEQLIFEGRFSSSVDLSPDRDTSIKSGGQ